MTDTAEVDWQDACARAKALRDAYYDRLVGGTTQRVRFRSGENDQEYQNSILRGGLEELRRAMLAAEDECRVSQGLAPKNRRFAIRAGSRRI